MSRERGFTTRTETKKANKRIDCELKFFRTQKADLAMLTLTSRDHCRGAACQGTPVTGPLRIKNSSLISPRDEGMVSPPQAVAWVATTSGTIPNITRRSYDAVPLR